MSVQRTPGPITMLLLVALGTVLLMGGAWMIVYLGFAICDLLDALRNT
jgi:hypothetical protein